ncbi:hypothetical protein QTI33_08690 [Variovorax sp. J22P271]|uniref:hypothetical protein n=1 Tax=Variovorax davisae TaxID=3053515 RepID=UPI0025786BA1|nr:hypothetical protein [Variovorax sp. J22P271]MDM0032209.1 hypothetical protein [Variovorax sp. J22P271]
MKAFTTTFLGIAMVLSVGSACAQAATKKDGSTSGTTMVMTMQQCKEHMAMSPAGAKKNDAQMKKDAMCADLMKKDGASMTKSGTAGEPMKK